MRIATFNDTSTHIHAYTVYKCKDKAAVGLVGANWCRDSRLVGDNWCRDSRLYTPPLLLKTLCSIYCSRIYTLPVWNLLRGKTDAQTGAVLQERRDRPCVLNLVNHHLFTLVCGSLG